MTGLIGRTFFINNAYISIYIAREPGIRLCALAERIRITRRAVQRTIGAWEKAGSLSRVREGRRDRGDVPRELPLRHSIGAHGKVREVLGLILKPKRPPD